MMTTASAGWHVGAVWAARAREHSTNAERTQPVQFDRPISFPPLGAPLGKCRVFLKAWEARIVLAMQTTDTQSAEYNLGVLKKQDPRIARVLHTAKHAVVYVYTNDESADSPWERHNVEGALHIVERSAEPRYQLFIHNRLSTDNLVESITPEFSIEVTEEVRAHSPRHRALARPLRHARRCARAPPAALLAPFCRSFCSTRTRRVRCSASGSTRLRIAIARPG